MNTPVWFVQNGDTLFVHTVANSGKVKRIRNNGQVNIAPCMMEKVFALASALQGIKYTMLEAKVKEED